MIKTNPFPALGPAGTAPGTGDIRPIKAAVPLPNPWIWAGLAIFGLAAALLAWWWWRRWRRKKDAPIPELVIPPHERARARLKEALALMDEPRPFCIAVSDTVRTYLEERFELRAPERTTEEFLEEIQGSALLAYEQKRILAEFLMGCDLVKFARFEPDRSGLQSTYDAAERLIEETQPLSATLSLGAADAATSRS